MRVFDQKDHYDFESDLVSVSSYFINKFNSENNENSIIIITILI